MCGRRRNADRHCVTLLQLGSNYFFSSIRKSHEPITPDNVCLSYSNCTMGKVYSHWLSSIYAFSLFFPLLSAWPITVLKWKLLSNSQYLISFITIVMFWWKNNFDALNAEGKKSLWIECIPILLFWLTIFPWFFKQTWYSVVYYWWTELSETVSPMGTKISKPNTRTAHSLLVSTEVSVLKALSGLMSDPQEWKAVSRSKVTSVKPWSGGTIRMFSCKINGGNRNVNPHHHKRVQQIWMSRKCWEPSLNTRGNLKNSTTSFTGIQEILLIHGFI